MYLIYVCAYLYTRQCFHLHPLFTSPSCEGGIIRYWYAVGMLICWLAAFKFWPSISVLSHASPLCSQKLADRTECLEDQVSYAANANSSEGHALCCGSGGRLVSTEVWCASRLGLGAAGHGQPKEEQRQFHTTHALKASTVRGYEMK